jgi:hypothetical protein
MFTTTFFRLQQRLDISRGREYVEDQHIAVFGDSIEDNVPPDRKAA